MAPHPTLDTPAGKRGRGRPAVGRDTPLTLEPILDAAQRILDTDGLEALSMRRLAADLGVTARALYNHVPSKPDLLEHLIQRVWESAVADMDKAPTDLFEWLIDVNVRFRRAWIDNIELANLSAAVAIADDAFFHSNQLATLVSEATGFRDPVMAYYVGLTFTMGSVSLRANRKVSSAYFGRDPDEVLDQARRRLDAEGASAEVRGVTEARFDAGDDALFEQSLRTILTSLLDGS